MGKPETSAIQKLCIIKTYRAKMARRHTTDSGMQLSARNKNSVFLPSWCRKQTNQKIKFKSKKIKIKGKKGKKEKKIKRFFFKVSAELLSSSAQQVQLADNFWVRQRHNLCGRRSQQRNN